MEPHRKRLRRIEVPTHVRYLTFSCFDRRPLLQNDRIKAVFVDRLAAAKELHQFELYAWVLMPEHSHLLLRPKLGGSTVPAILQSLKQSVAQRVIARWKELGAPVLSRLADPRGAIRFWQPGGGYDRNVVSSAEVIEKIEYTHDNPRRRGLCTCAIDYPWSSARWYAGDRAGPLTMDSLPQ